MPSSTLPGRSLRLRAGAVAIVAVFGGLILPAGTAQAALREPSGIRLVKVSTTSFSVAADREPKARKYRMFASTNKRDLWLANISRAHKSALSSKPVLSLSGLPFTTAPYYYRLEALDGSHTRFSSTINAVGLRPATPTGLSVAHNGAGIYLKWASGAATGFRVVRASNSSFTQNRQVYVVRGNIHQFTPPGLVSGEHYFFAVRALNSSTPSWGYASTSATSSAREQRVSVMSYNILDASQDGVHEGSGRVASWSKRKLKAAALIREAQPDAIAIQEGAPFVGAHRERQVDSLRKALGGAYALAHTEVSPQHRGYFRTGDYILYKKSTYSAIDHSGHWALGNRHFAVYQVLKNRSTGAKFLFVDPHLIVGSGATFDRYREAETERMISDATRKAAAAHTPIVYAGDFNSDNAKGHAFDGPGIAMRKAHVSNAFKVAQSRTNASYDSANQYLRIPPRYATDIDYVWATPGVAVLSWKIVIHVSHGRLVGVIPSDHNPIQSELEFPY